MKGGILFPILVLIVISLLTIRDAQHLVLWPCSVSPPALFFPSINDFRKFTYGKWLLQVGCAIGRGCLL